jgi:amidase
MGPDIAARFAAAAEVTVEDVARADDVRATVRAAVSAATSDGTVLVQPAAAGAAPLPLSATPSSRDAHELRRVQTLRLTCIAGLAGAPVVVFTLLRWAVQRMAT